MSKLKKIDAFFFVWICRHETIISVLVTILNILRNIIGIILLIGYTILSTIIALNFSIIHSAMGFTSKKEVLLFFVIELSILATQLLTFLLVRFVITTKNLWNYL